MATTTPNFGWPVPTSTDLVKDGATAIEALGDAIDASLVDLEGGTTGQILAKASNADMDFAWITNDVGDITAVTAGTGISGGGTSGAVTITNSMATEITAKGDLIVGTGSATFDNLAAGSNGDTLVADSSTSTGLRYNANFAAGKNKLINGDFYVNQRNLTSQTTDGGFGFDRWRMYASGGGTYSAQTFTPGAAPVAGYEGRNFARIVTAGQSGAGVYTSLDQPIEDVRTFAGQTVTFSFWAKTTSGTPVVSIELLQLFGSGGSGPTYINGGTVTLSTSWTRYTKTVSIPSISGQTIGTSSALAVTFWVSAGTSFASRANSIGIQSGTFDFWGAQLEAGSVATAFQTATGTIQGELSAAQRYYYLHASGTSKMVGNGAYYSASEVDCMIQFPVTMRTTPTIDQTTGTDYYTFYRNGGADGFNSFTISYASTTGTNLFNASQVSGTAGQAGQIATNNASAYLGFSAEL